MNFRISSDLDKQLRKIKSKDKKLIHKIEKQLIIFGANHLHPSLHTHKLTGNLNNLWSISIDRSIRMLFILDDDGACFFDVGTHDKVYKK